MTKGGKLTKDLFEGATINTPSMLAVADYQDALDWMKQIGGLSAAIKRAESNLKVLADFVAAHDWINFLAESEAIRSCTSVCLTLDLTEAQVKAMVKLLAKEGVAYDIGAYRDAPAGLRIWCGSTIETADLQALMPWLVWAYETVKSA
jgi:phosphoserine aminotransferase